MARTYDLSRTAELREVTALISQYAAEVRRLANQVISAIEALDPEGGCLSSSKMDEALTWLDGAVATYRSLRSEQDRSLS
jgi:uncharacterized protein YnzC (UPF0291/DUF896 family)